MVYPITSIKPVYKFSFTSKSTKYLTKPTTQTPKKETQSSIYTRSIFSWYWKRFK